ncbi:MAG: SET domain-containing protein [Bacteroidota bacterium]|nr:SET domain-containing protein [Bacteroidota bacterium]
MLTNPTSAYNVLSRHGFADVMQNVLNGEHSLHATVFFDAGDTLASFAAGKIVETPTYLTVQVGHQKHILLDPEFLQYINHSCDPNVFFDTTEMKLVALKNIQPGDEIVFFYPSAEWDMAQPFACYCGSGNCIHQISGAAHLSEDVIRQYRFTDFIVEQLSKTKQ